jgi:hypothetical protein
MMAYMGGDYIILVAIPKRMRVSAHVQTPPSNFDLQGGKGWGLGPDCYNVNLIYGNARSKAEVGNGYK